MKTIYLTRSFQPRVVDVHKPGDSYEDPDYGVCRRLTASRLCLAGERAGKESKALLGLLRAIGELAVDDTYDGRTVEGWYGLVGIAPPEPEPDEMVRAVCPECRCIHWALREHGRIWDGGVCGPCVSKNYLVAQGSMGPP